MVTIGEKRPEKRLMGRSMSAGGQYRTRCQGSVTRGNTDGMYHKYNQMKRNGCSGFELSYSVWLVSE